MRTIIEPPMRYRARAIVAAALAPFMLAGPVFANDGNKTVMANAELAHAQETEQERIAPGYYDRAADNAQTRADALDREGTKYYEEQKRQADKRAAELEREATAYYGKRR